MSPASRLHVPKPPARPGDQPDFAYLSLSPAGAVPRPEASAPLAETLPLATQLVRVLDDQHRAVGPWNPRLDAETLRAGLRWMLLTRIYDERMLKAHRQGRISFYMQCTGEEAVAVGAGLALDARDMAFPSYRCQGLHFLRGMDTVDLMCQLLSNTRDMCKGRQLPVMYHSAEKRLFSISGNLATQVPQAVGWAMAAAIKGEKHVAATWLGEGSTAEADVHYAQVFASTYRAPVIINIVNNQWAISTFQGFAAGDSPSFAARGPGFGIPGIRVDGNDLLAVHAVTSWAAERARQGLGATLIEHVTYRASAHSTSDDPSRYRPKSEAAAWPLGDPLDRLKKHLVALGEWSEEQHEALAAELGEHVGSAWKEACSYGTLGEPPRLDPLSLFEDVFAEMPEHLRRQQAALARELEPK